ncbi:hypothetical protein TPR58_20575 [Sphingomonas sp. HF-S3]|uniref:Uncharacterized protein n=1 Tax=Sphingomonas rustica TaxID=3103142 RepID=A0ABV0BEC0_9SPHN
MSALQNPVKSVVSYGFLTLSTLFLLWVASEIHDVHRWYAAQGHDGDHYPYVPLFVAMAALATGFLVVRTRVWPAAIPTTVLVMLLSYGYWLGTVA